MGVAVAQHLPSPSSGPSVSSYITFCLFVAVIFLWALSSLGHPLTIHIEGLRQALGMRAS
jgi:hypothetical protein